MIPWRNGSASDSRSEGCVFESRRDQSFSFRDPHFKNFIDILLQDFIYAIHQMMDASS